MLSQSKDSWQQHGVMARKLVAPPTGLHTGFALRFRHACDHARLPSTLAELKKVFGVSEPTVHAWRHGEKLPSARKMEEIAKKLKCSYDWLATGRGDATPPLDAESVALARRIMAASVEKRRYIDAILRVEEDPTMLHPH